MDFCRQLFKTEGDRRRRGSGVVRTPSEDAAGDGTDVLLGRGDELVLKCNLGNFTSFHPRGRNSTLCFQAAGTCVEVAAADDVEEEDVDEDDDVEAATATTVVEEKGAGRSPVFPSFPTVHRHAQVAGVVGPLVGVQSRTKDSSLLGALARAMRASRAEGVGTETEEGWGDEHATTTTSPSSSWLLAPIYPLPAAADEAGTARSVSGRCLLCLATAPKPSASNRVWVGCFLFMILDDQNETAANQKYYE
jgi:hypothetical protein